MQQSLRRGEIVHIDVPHTIADGAQTQHPGRYTFPVIQALVADVVTVSDEALKRALRFFAARMKIVVEPTGCLGAAAAFEGGDRGAWPPCRRDPQRRQRRSGALRDAACRLESARLVAALMTPQAMRAPELPAGCVR